MSAGALGSSGQDMTLRRTQRTEKFVIEPVYVADEDGDATKTTKNL